MASQSVATSSAAKQEQGHIEYVADDSTEIDSRRRSYETPAKQEEDDEEDDEENELLPEARPSNPRNEVAGKNTPFRSNVLHVYGLDFLKTSHMDEIFGQFGHKFIEWINDSAANIMFAQADKAKKALEALSFPKTGDDPWRRTPDILVSEDMPPIFLQMRYATSGDAKPTKKAIPKAPMVPPPQRRRGKGGSRGVAGAVTEGGGGEGGIATKRPKPPPTAEERERRQKRAKRFADWLVDTGKDAGEGADAANDAAKAAAAASPSARDRKGGHKEAGPPRTVVLEVTQEEIARRKKRLERFGADSAVADGSGGSPAAASALEASSAADAAATDSTAAEAKGSPEASMEAAAVDKKGSPGGSAEAAAA